eukprot:CAMPEP_0182913260 /NCGR_PEP_ID=MMETSP0034_2-20130328/37945_1 /TAXON_ID=156128 /ORGANISM="Nephroselmis pyriformis, Strain CCMP717" /LENGTH=141 /DNA_ID=CAMNT_0025049973 /DNA_START=18 /DNA_END=443 /DNA_ORIENTATION=+
MMASLKAAPTSMKLGAPAKAPARFANNIVSAPARPVALQSEFMGLQSLTKSFTGLSMSVAGPAKRLGGDRAPLEIVAGKRGGGMGANRVGSKVSRMKTSGFRARMSSPTGKSVIKARRKKGRKTLAPASCRGSAKQKRASK